MACWVKSSDESLNDVRSQYEALQEEYRTLKDHVENLHRQKQHIKDETRKLASSLSARELRLTDLQKSHSKAEEKLDSVKRDLKRSQSRLHTEISSHESDRQKLLNELQCVKNQLTEDRNRHVDQLEGMHRTLKVLKEEHNRRHVSFEFCLYHNRHH